MAVQTCFIQTFLEKEKSYSKYVRKGNCLDNAIIENFWGTLKTEWFYLTDFDSVDMFLEQLESYIHYFNYKRDSSVLDYRTPVEARIEKIIDIKNQHDLLKEFEKLGILKIEKSQVTIFNF